MLSNGDILTAFDHQPRTRIVFGVGCAEQVGEYARSLGATSVLLVTDQGIVEAGHARRVRDALAGEGLRIHVFDQVRQNPTTRDVDACLAIARSATPAIDLIVGLGGGSSIDTAKGCNFILTNGGAMRDYWGVGKANRPMLPLIAMPTTAGTGSECQSFALIADEQTHHKMACGDPKAAARIAVLDPTLTITQPRSVTTCTGIDALAHAVESSVATRRSPLSLIYSREAFSLIVRQFEAVLDNGENLHARSAMLLGAAFGGTAIENSMLGAAHSAANPLTARFGVIHGWAVGIMLPHVIAYNALDRRVAGQYADLARCAELAGESDDVDAAVTALIERVRQLLASAQIPPSLAACEVDRAAIPDMAREAAKQWTARFNPRPIGAEDFARLYEAAYSQT